MVANVPGDVPKVEDLQRRLAGAEPMSEFYRRLAEARAALVARAA